jgi:uncharacterized protein
MNRAYSKIEIKAADDERREFTGIATTPTTDRMGDIVEPLGAKFSLPIPLLWQHDSQKPVGEVTHARVTTKGIEIRGRILQATQSRTLIDRLDEAWESIKIGLVKGLSIGFSPIKQEPIKGSYGLRFLEWDLHELSPVTIPANVDGSIQSIKSIDRQLRAASGQREGVVFLDESVRCASRKQGVIYID